MKKFESTGSVEDKLKGNVGRPKTATSATNIESAREMFEISPQKSVRREAQKLGISVGSVHHYLQAELHLFPYKIQTHQPLGEKSIERRFDFANLLIEMVEHNQLNPELIWFSDEAHFHLDGYVNKQNWRIWGTENPHFSVQKTLYPQRVTVWCAISKRGIVGTNIYQRDCYGRALHLFVKQ